jgi:hypothetical protein
MYLWFAIQVPGKKDTVSRIPGEQEQSHHSSVGTESFVQKTQTEQYARLPTLAPMQDVCYFGFLFLNPGTSRCRAVEEQGCSTAAPEHWFLFPTRGEETVMRISAEGKEDFLPELPRPDTPPLFTKVKDNRRAAPHTEAVLKQSGVRTPQATPSPW